MPVISIAVAYAGVMVGLGALSVLSTPEYEHVTDLHVGLVGLGWSLLAVASLTVSIISLRRSIAPLPPLLPGTALVLQGLVVMMLAAALPISIVYLAAYRNGIAAYDAEAERCGHPPVLASVNIMGGKDVLLPSDSDYQRLKYSTAEPLIFGPTIYYCSLAEAEANGYQRQT